MKKKDDKLKTVLFLGRFQPFHLGHLHVVKELSKKYRLVIGIGSANISRSEMNPFTSKEREEMIKRVLKKENIKAKIYKIKDITFDEHYSEHVFQIVSFDFLACSNKIIQSFFNGKRPILEFPLYRNISATRIRKNICQEKEWKSLVHEEAIKYIKEIDGEKIIKDIGCYDDE